MLNITFVKFIHADFYHSNLFAFTNIWYSRTGHNWSVFLSVDIWATAESSAVESFVLMSWCVAARISLSYVELAVGLLGRKVWVLPLLGKIIIIIIMAEWQLVYKIVVLVYIHTIVIEELLLFHILCSI